MYLLILCTCVPCQPVAVALFPFFCRNSFLVEFVVIAVPLVLALTICANYVLHLYAALFMASLLVAAVKWSPAADLQSTLWNFLHMPVPKPFPFLTQSRISVTLLSVLAILAVDFPVFPRRFAKTETYGVGLMDVGVGLFVSANGSISPEARSALSKDLQRQWHVWRNLKGTLPLLVLGFVRLVATATADYHLHESEYGSHWNFFFTLAVIRVRELNFPACLACTWFLCTVELIGICTFSC